MNVSKLLVSGTAAAAVIAAIGFAYAQTTPYNPSGTPANPQTQSQDRTPAQSTVGTPSTPSMQDRSPSTSTGNMDNRTTGMSDSRRTDAAGRTTDGTGNMGNERTARADRN